MGFGPSREEKIQQCIDDTQDKIQNIKSLRDQYIREEKRYTQELQRIPRDKKNDILAKAKLIASVQIRKKMTEATIVQLQAMEQNFHNISLQNTMVRSMVETDTFMKEINEETNMRNVNQLISKFQRNLDTLSNNQNQLSDTLIGTMEGLEANTDEIVQNILRENHIQFDLENRQLSGDLLGMGVQTQQQPTMPVPIPYHHQQQQLEPIYTAVAAPAVDDERRRRLEALKNPLFPPPSSASADSKANM